MDFEVTSYFIGRHAEREKIKELLLFTDIQVLQIYGLPSSGKTELIRQVCRELSSEVEARSFYKRITNEQWLITDISQFLQDIRNSKMLSLIVFDCFENISKLEEFVKFCLETLWNNSYLKIILIFQGSFPLKIDGISDDQFQLKPMNKEDARSLFYRRTKLVLNDQSDKQVDELIDYCGGLPGQIDALTTKLSKLPANTSLAKVYKFVKENKSYCQHENIFEKLNRYMKSLPTKQRRALSEVVYFPGTFTAKDITKMANYKNDLDTEFSFVYPLLSHGLLKPKDENNQEFQVPTLFQDYARMHLAHLRHEDTTKLKFSTIIGKTLIEAENLWEEGLIYEALGIMKNNWANVQKLFQQAIHSPSDGNSFQIYYEVMVDASNIISLCYPNEAKLFCKAISDNAKIFGSEIQRALSMAAYGHTLVESSEKEAIQLYRNSEEVLRKHNHSYQLVILLYKMSEAYYRSGKLHKGIRCAEEALTILVTDRDSTDIQHVKTYAATYLAYNLIFATEYLRADEIVQQTLQEVGESGHPSVPTLLNLLGLKEERSRGDLNKALTWYLASLSKKRKIAKFQEPLLVPTLCNVAGQLSKTKLKHCFALTFLYEAESIRRRAGWFHNYSALVVWNIGMVYMRQHMYRDALMKIKEAETLYETVNFEHYVNAEVKVWLSHCHLLLDEAQEAKKKLFEVVNNGPIYHKYRPQGEFVLNALEHLIHLSMDPKEQQTYIEKMLEELIRLNKSPGVCPISSGKYLQLRLKYRKILVMVLDNSAKTEFRSGIFLECIPDTCLACQEVLNYKMCSKDAYLQKMNYRTSICRLSEGIDRIAVRSLAYREPQEQNENKSARRDTKTSTTTVSRISKEIDNVPFLKSESLNSGILPLPVKELCNSDLHLESVSRISKEIDNVPFLKSESLNSGILPLPVKELCNSDLHLESVSRISKEIDNVPFQKSESLNSGILPLPVKELCNSDLHLESVSRISKEIDNVPFLKSESLNSGILPLPVKELCNSDLHLESVGSHQEVSNGCPDFNALSLEETIVPPEVRVNISERQNSTSKTIVKNGITEYFFSNLTGESPRLFGENDKQLWDFRNSNKIQQTPNNQEIYCRNPARADTQETKFFDYSASTNGDVKTEQKFQTILKSQRIIEDSKIKEKPIVPSWQITNMEKPNQLQKNNSTLSTQDPKIDSAKNSNYGSQRPKSKIILEQQNQEHYWKNHRVSQYTSSSESKTTKTATHLDCLKKKPAPKDLSQISTSQKPFSTIATEQKLLNSSSPLETHQNILEVRRQINKYFNKPSSQHVSRGRGREPVEHDEKIN